MSKVKPYPEYSNFGQEWLNELPTHWNVMRTKLLFDLITDPAPVGNSEELLSVYTALGVKPRKELEARGNKASSTDNYWRVKQGDIIVNKLLAWMGAIGISEYNGVTSPAYDILRANKNINPYFYNYLFRNPIASREFKRHSRGIMDMRLRLYFTRFGDIKLPYPSIDEQTAIANFLDYKLKKIDRFLSKKKQLTELLDEQKAAIINELVTGKKIWDGNAWTEPVEVKPSGIEWLGDIPESWEIRKLKEISMNFGRIGFRGYKTTDLVNKGEGAITISPSNIKESFMTFEKCSYLSWEKYEQSPEIMIYNNDILMVKTGSTYGKVGIVKGLKEKATINPQLLVFKNILINPIYLYHLLKSNLVQIQVKREVIGSTIPTISQTKISNFKIVLPSKNEIDNILILIKTESNKIEKTISTIKKEIALVEEYKTALIAEAVTGKIDVREWSEPLISTD